MEELGEDAAAGGLVRDALAPSRVGLAAPLLRETLKGGHEAGGALWIVSMYPWVLSVCCVYVDEHCDEHQTWPAGWSMDSELVRPWCKIEFTAIGRKLMMDMRWMMMTSVGSITGQALDWQMDGEGKERGQEMEMEGRRP